jgi:hypothetical protein
MLEIPTASMWCMAHQPALGLEGFHSFGRFSASCENQEHWAGLRKDGIRADLQTMLDTR